MIWLSNRLARNVLTLVNTMNAHHLSSISINSTLKYENCRLLQIVKFWFSRHKYLGHVTDISISSAYLCTSFLIWKGISAHIIKCDLLFVSLGGKLVENSEILCTFYDDTIKTQFHYTRTQNLRGMIDYKLIKSLVTVY